VLIRDIQPGDFVAYDTSVDPIDSPSAEWWLVTHREPHFSYPGTWQWRGLYLAKNELEDVLAYRGEQTIPPCFFIFRDGELIS
jgi:hypothetical protein